VLVISAVSDVARKYRGKSALTGGALAKWPGFPFLLNLTIWLVKTDPAVLLSTPSLACVVAQPHPTGTAIS
jgi:hypothetical protein